MDGARTSRVTPWVTRLILFNGSILLLLYAVFTAPRFIGALTFDPATFPKRPWTAVTYLFAHAGILHWAINSLLLFVFGPPVERKLGTKAFLAYYLYCGIGAALFAYGLSNVLRVDPFIGASGAVFGITLAFVIHWPEAQLRVFPIPAPISAKHLFLALLVLDVALGLLVRDGIAHLVHVGGALAGYAFFRVRRLAVRKAPPARPASVIRRPVVTPMRVQETVTELRPATPPLERHEEVSEEEVDRVLDKISRFGIESLTSQERKFLSEVSERKRREQH